MTKEVVTITINWRIVRKNYSKTISYYFKLCLTEDVSIIHSLDDTNLLNKQSSFKLS